MAFSDTLLSSSSSSKLRVVVVDKHATPGGQWHDSYGFVRLHQPSFGYGVESRHLEPPGVDVPGETAPEDLHRATREEILAYYGAVAGDLSANHDFSFWGNHTLDLSQLGTTGGADGAGEYGVTDGVTGTTRTVRVRRRVVDARNLEPDLPVSTPPRFGCAPNIDIRPVNDLATDPALAAGTTTKTRFVVVGGGKTGMDAVHHLLEDRKTDPQNLLWIVPNHAWITAREKIGNCVDLLYTAAKIHENEQVVDDEDEKKDSAAAASSSSPLSPIGPDFFQKAFLRWEQEGHVYRLDPGVVPTKFKDATLCRAELEVLKRAVPSRTVQRGRVSSVTDTGALVFADGSTMELPGGYTPETTLFLHCSAGAFHFTKSNRSPPPVFSPGKITVQDVYGTPGFCFVGSLIGKLESLSSLDDSERNAMALRPVPGPPPKPGEAVSGGDVLGPVTEDHGFVQRAQNLSAWLTTTPELRDWVLENRLFHLVGADPSDLSDRLGEIFRILRRSGLSV